METKDVAVNINLDYQLPQCGATSNQEKADTSVFTQKDLSNFSSLPDTFNGS